MEFSGRNVVVTGAGRGIGTADYLIAGAGAVGNAARKRPASATARNRETAARPIGAAGALKIIFRRLHRGNR